MEIGKGHDARVLGVYLLEHQGIELELITTSESRFTCGIAIGQGTQSDGSWDILFMRWCSLMLVSRI